MAPQFSLQRFQAAQTLGQFGLLDGLRFDRRLQLLFSTNQIPVDCPWGWRRGGRKACGHLEFRLALLFALALHDQLVDLFGLFWTGYDLWAGMGRSFPGCVAGRIAP
ncbi:MAG: hypothetical protein JNM61_01465 [Zoogloeaceae bacterium]|nr:hypothetical protein [Zoogloeaceae bacterium]